MESGSGKKRRHGELFPNQADEEERRGYMFRVLLPNGHSVRVTLSDQTGDGMSVGSFLELVRKEYVRNLKEDHQDVKKSKRKIDWMSHRVYLEDVVTDTKWRDRVVFTQYEPKLCHILKLHDGQENPAKLFKNMWDVTPDTTELPSTYTFLTALADLIDNSLQAVWLNDRNERRMVSVVVKDDGILVADTGPGMNGAGETSIAKWGKMGLAFHSSSRRQAIGGKPPYLKPFFGMFGYGGPIASTRLGRHTLVSSKMKNSNKVYTLHIKREALLHSSSGMSWKISGGLRDPLNDELSSSPHGSFTKVEILQPERTPINAFRLQCRLKDIYFPYIQYDELTTGKTRRPVEFQVNGEDLAEVQGGEVAITNLHSCNGPEFVLQLHLSNENSGTSRSPGSRLVEANARLRCVYFPVREGKESFDRILEKLEADKCGISENFDTFCRVSIRRLGRLLPDARWPRLPFMDLEHRKGDKAELLKRCSLRVKCFIDTDAGFNPTHSKNDLAQHRFTTALKNIGRKLLERDGINLEIHRDEKALSLSQLEEEYEDWILKMHDTYDEELGCGQDQPVIVVNPANKKRLGISSDVIRVHKFIKRKGQSWKAGHFIKIIPRDKQHKVYATLEFVLLEGFEGDAGGEARIICRPIDVPAENGCSLKVDGGNSYLDLQSSSSFPVNMIDSGECSKMDPTEWKHQLERLQLKAPSTIDLLSPQHCQQLKIDGAFPVEPRVLAGHRTPKEIIAVIRPANYTYSSACNSLKQEFILKDDLEMSMEVKFIAISRSPLDEKSISSQRVRPSSHGGYHGLYVFALGSKSPELFKAAGTYKFKFSVICADSREIKCEKTLLVKSRNNASRWRLIDENGLSARYLRVGSYFPPFAIECYDEYDNRVQFKSIPELDVAITSRSCRHGTMVSHVEKPKVKLLSKSMILQVSDLLIESRDLDKIRPKFEATLGISCSHDKLLSVNIPFFVVPGSLHHVDVFIPDLEKELLPGDVIGKILLEMYDSYGNHVQEGIEVILNVDGFCFQDNAGPKRKVDAEGCIMLNGILKVTRGHGKSVSFSVEYEEHLLFKKEVQVGRRELRILSTLPDTCAAGSQLESVIFGVVDSDGTVDETIHDDVLSDQSHTLALRSVSLEVGDCSRFTFHHGRCRVPFISVPREPGIFSFSAAHSCYPELVVVAKVNVVQAPKLEVNLAEHEDVPFQSPNGKMIEPVSALSRYNLSDVKELHSDVERIRLFIEQLEKNLETLKEEKAFIEREISELKDQYEHQTTGHLGVFVTDKDDVIKHIQMNNTAASVLCSLAADIQSMMPMLVGVVALLGSVNTDSLSRMLAEYLGEDLMNAVVCKSYANACSLEKYSKSGEIDPTVGLHSVAAELGSTINCEFLVICLENLCPYSGMSTSNDPQEKLALVDPISSTGEIPSGFLGYAVNMINIDIQHLHTRTKNGYDLRQTLFYHLFGELQVYGTRQQMNLTRELIKHGAISLDGGIIKGSGILSLGPRKKPGVRFPVVNIEGHPQIAPDIAKKLEEKKFELGEVMVKLEKVSKEQDKAKKRVGKKMKHLKRSYNELEPLKELLPCDKDTNVIRQLFSTNQNFSGYAKI